MIFGYTRVSSSNQNLDRQIHNIKSYCEENKLMIEDRNIIRDIQSGKDFNRDGYRVLKDQILRRGDVLIISELDRLGRNKIMIKEELLSLKDKGVTIRILNIPTTLINLDEQNDWVMDMVNNILIEVLSAMAEEERLNIRKRQREGIDRAREKGISMGRPRKDWDTISHKQREVFKDLFPKWKEGAITGVQFMDRVNLKKSTFYKIVGQYVDILDGLSEDI